MSFGLRLGTREPSELLGRWQEYTLSSPQEGTSSLEGRCHPGKHGVMAPISAQSARGYSGRSIRHDPSDRLKDLSLTIVDQVSFMPVTEDSYLEVRLVVAIHLTFLLTTLRSRSSKNSMLDDTSSRY